MYTLCTIKMLFWDQRFEFVLLKCIPDVGQYFNCINEQTKFRIYLICISNVLWLIWFSIEWKYLNEATLNWRSEDNYHNVPSIWPWRKIMLTPFQLPSWAKWCLIDCFPYGGRGSQAHNGLFGSFLVVVFICYLSLLEIHWFFDKRDEMCLEYIRR